MQILNEFKETHKFYEKKYKNTTAFRSQKFRKNEKGETEPVFYVGVPGLMVALTFAAVIIATVYLLYLPFMWSVWVPYVIGIMFLFRIALKIDKVKQVRFMVYYLIDSGMKQLVKADDAEDSELQGVCVERAIEWLEKAQSWVDEPGVKAQLELLKKA